MDKERMLVKERRFTETEVITMQEWIRDVLRAVGLSAAIVNAEAAIRADRILRDGLHFEHWDAVLSEHPEERSQENVEQFEVYKKAFADALAPVRELPPAISEAKHEVSQDVRE